ncbi:MAG: YitT family protein [Lachnospiraceae bacterium]|nr:YitT family protein [Lachnospiraceae bacterium]
MNKDSINLRKNMTVRVIAVSVASLIMALNINTFIHTGGLLPGGASGLTLLIQEICFKFLNISVPYTLINVLINAIPVYIGFKFIGKRFTLLSCWVIVLTSVLTDILPSWVVTQDTLLISIFGGLINGFAISICLLADSTSGGTDFVAIYLSEKKGIDSFHVPLFINAGILTAAGLLFGWDKALYSILFQYASTAVIRTLYRKFQQATLFIVTNHAKEVADVIYKTSNHGATIFEGEGAFEHCERRVVYSVISSAESSKVTKAIKEIDPEAFVNVLKTERVLGRFYQRPTD